MGRVEWSVLGIEPTKDIKEIKHAYAAASKRYHPEEHPEAFKRLQKAYKEAIQFAKSKGESFQEPLPKPEYRQPPAQAMPSLKVKNEFVPPTQSQSPQKEIATENSDKVETPIPEMPNAKTEMFAKSKGESFQEPLSKPEYRQPPAQAMPSLKVKNEFVPPTQSQSPQKEIVTENSDKVEAPIPEMPNAKTEMFHYEEILSGPEEDWFWRKLDYICWHPYVRKSRVYWEFLLNQPDITGKMQDAGYRGRFKERLIEENFVWDSDVLEFLDGYLNQYVTAEDTFSKNWASKHLHSEEFPKKEKEFETETEEQVYRMLWGNVEENIRHDPRLYLKYYFSYADMNYGKLKKIHREASLVRRNRPIKRILTVLFFVMVFILVIHNKIMEEKQEKELEALILDEVSVEIHSSWAQYRDDEEFMKLVEEYAPSYIDNDMILMFLYEFRHNESLLIEELQILQNEGK